MEAGANRDMSSIHHDNDIARATGAPAAFANTFFLMGMFERLLREWMGLQGRLKSINGLMMAGFSAVGDLVSFHGIVERCDSTTVIIDLWVEGEMGRTAAAKATLELPQKTD